MYIGNIPWKRCRLKTSFAFGNKKCVLETYIGYWKHNMDVGNIRIRFETSLSLGNTYYWNIYWKHITKHHWQGRT